MDQQEDAFGVGLQRGALYGAVLGAVFAAVWSGSVVTDEDARTIVVMFVVLGGFAGSLCGVLCATLIGVVHELAQRAGAGAAWWVAAGGALVAGLVTVGGVELWPLLFGGLVAPGLQVGWVAVCALVTVWQVRRVQHSSAG